MCNEEDKLIIKPLDNFFQATVIISIFSIILLLIGGVEKNIILLFLASFIVMIWWGFLKMETLTLSSRGIHISGLCYSREYLWNEIKVKQVNKHMIPTVDMKTKIYTKNIVFSLHRRIKTKYTDPAYLKLLFPRSLYYVYIKTETMIPEEDGAFRGAVNERILAEMLKKWHVELSGDELGIQAWEEKF